MKSPGIFLFVCITCISASSQLLFKLENDSLKYFSYKGGDEFNGQALDDGKWQNGLGGRRVLMSQDLAFTPKNVVIQKGLARFIALKEDSSYILRENEIDSAVL